MASEFSSARLGRVRSLLERHVESGAAPGAVAVLARRGRVVVEAVGTHAFDGAGAQTPFTAESVCRLGSMTKPLVAACAMTLVEDGTLRLDDPVDRLLPELADLRVLRDPAGPLDDTVPAERPITLRDLLTFRLGTGMVLADPDEVPIAKPLMALEDGEPGVPRPGQDEWIRRLGELPLVHQPGERWMYSTGSNVLGVLLSRATGLSFGDALHERVFAPLGMAGAGFFVPADQLDRLPTAYTRDEATGGAVVDDPPDGQFSRPPAFCDGGGGLVATPVDFLAFASALLAGGVHRRERWLSRAAVTLMTTDHLTPAQKATSGFFADGGHFAGLGWGFGVGVRIRRDQLGPSVGAYGWNGYYGTTWYNDPAEGLTAMLFQQRNDDPSRSLLPSFWTAVYQALGD